MEQVAHALVAVAGVLLVGAIGEYIFKRTGVPDALWLVCTGILLGPVLELVPTASLIDSIPILGALALTVILSGGAYKFQLSELAAIGPRAILLSIVSFVVTVIAVVAGYWLLTYAGLINPFPLILWILAAAIAGSAGAEIIIPTMASAKVESHTARFLEIESSSSDALVVVAVMVILDLAVHQTTSLSAPFVTLASYIGVGLFIGIVAAALMIPFVPTLRDKAHAYIIFLACMFITYSAADKLGGNGALAVLTAALVLGNATSIVPRLIPGARPDAFTDNKIRKTIEEQIIFIVKSFFFTLVGLMFPTNPRILLVALIFTAILLVSRIVAVKLSMIGAKLSLKQFCVLSIAIPRGLATGVLSTLPFHAGMPGVENFSPAVFAVIVFSITVYSIGLGVISRIPDTQNRGS